MKQSRYYIETFGCQMNVNDSEKVAGLLEREGFTAVDSAQRADLVFVNTCAVREKAAEKLYHTLGRLKQLKRKHPDLLVGVGGCVAQLQGAQILDRAPQVDLLVGTHNVGRVPELARRAREGQGRQIDLDRHADRFAVPASAIAHTSLVRAYVTVMEGCNHVCSFCVVPRTRGPEVCRAPEDVVAEVRSLALRGCPEVMLLGQTVDAYRHGHVDFPGLLERVHEIEGVQRVRFTTSHPEHVSERLAVAMRDLPKVCPYLHLPVQSGSERILASMRRGYTRAGYLEKVALLRDHVPDLALTTDVIAGYPSETAEDFEATGELVDEVGFDGVFVFPYSPRPGTTAVRLPDDVPDEEKRRRVTVLNDRQQRRQRVKNRERIGVREEVLVDTVGADPGRVSGRTRPFRIVHLDGDAGMLGRFVEVEITAAGSNSLQGRRLVNPSLTSPSAASIF